MTDLQQWLLNDIVLKDIARRPLPPEFHALPLGQHASLNVCLTKRKYMWFPFIDAKHHIDILGPYIR